jgi:penicillinase repressor
VVERRKTGRAYVYRPLLSAEEARAQALGQVLDNFFGGSKEALLAQLGAGPTARSTATEAPVNVAPVIRESDPAETFPRERLDHTVI